MELPTFTGGIAAFKNAQAELVGVEQAADGIDLDALDAAWRRRASRGKAVKLLYLVPNFQNPDRRTARAGEADAHPRTGRSGVTS